MRYAIVTNPVSGKMNIDQKLLTLAHAAKILDAKIYGLDTGTAREFCLCALEVAAHCDVLVVAGGDGAFSDIINSVDPVQTPIAYLPLGTGNAMRHALNYRGALTDIALRIKNGKIKEYDLINCDAKRKGFMVSVGIEGIVVKLWERYREQGSSGFKAYLRAASNAYFKQYERTTAMIAIDENEKELEVKKLLSLMVMKQPYYGFGMKVVPKARFDDRLLHILCINSGLFQTIIGGVTSFTGGNRIGRYFSGRQLSLRLRHPLLVQIDGDQGWEAETFNFTVLPKALKIKS